MPDPSLPSPSATHVEMIFGRAGSGKSRLLAQLCRRDARLIVADTCQEHGALAPPAALADVREDARSGRPFRASCFCHDAEDMEWLCQLAASTRGATLAVDEYSFWWNTPQHVPARGLLTMIRTGRKPHQRVVVTTQSPSSINKQNLSQARLWIFPLDELADIDYVLARTAGKVDPRELEPLATEPDPEAPERRRVLVARVASFCFGERVDWQLDTRTAELTRS